MKARKEAVRREQFRTGGGYHSTKQSRKVLTKGGERKLIQKQLKEWGL